MKHTDLRQLEQTIHYTFSDKELLKTALTHKTFAYEASLPVEYNERLEFLGDSILNFIATEQLYASNKYFSEGELTRRRSIIVNNRFLARRARELQLGTFLLLGKGEHKQNGAENRTNLANMLEALIGAIYLDAGLDAAKQFILEHVFTDDFRF
jgi:ribonuclease-3